MPLPVIPAKRGLFRPSAELGPTGGIGAAAIREIEPSSLLCWVPDLVLAEARAVWDDNDLQSSS
jgi:hypothetical protein